MKRIQIERKEKKEKKDERFKEKVVKKEKKVLQRRKDKEMTRQGKKGEGYVMTKVGRKMNGSLFLIIFVNGYR